MKEVRFFRIKAFFVFQAMSFAALIKPEEAKSFIADYEIGRDKRISDKIDAIHNQSKRTNPC